jgi:hypothetical protein
LALGNDEPQPLNHCPILNFDLDGFCLARRAGIVIRLETAEDLRKEAEAIAARRDLLQLKAALDYLRNRIIGWPFDPGGIRGNEPG